MYHYSAVLKGPFGTAGDLVSNETILDTQDIMGKWAFVKQMTEFTFKLVIAVIGDLQDSVLYPESLTVVVV